MNATYAFTRSRTYEHNQYASLSPEKITLALFDGILTFIDRACAAIDSGHVAHRGEAVSRALAVIGELHATLRPEPAPELVGALSTLYDYLTRELIKANIAADQMALMRCAGIVRTLRDGWAEMIKSLPAAAKTAAGGGGGYL